MGSFRLLLAASVALLALENACFASADAYGTATYYTAPYVPSDAFWNGGGVCGDYYWVWCTAGCTNWNPILVRIVDYCPAGCSSTIDLSQAAFSAIANLGTGKISVGYNFAYSG